MNPTVVPGFPICTGGAGVDAPSGVRLFARGARVILVLFAAVLLFGGGRVAHSQVPDSLGRFCKESARRTVNLDTRGLGAMYCSSSPALVTPLTWAHASARPIFYGAVPAAWLGALFTAEDAAYADAYRLTMSQGTTYGLVLALKRAVGRPRPFVRRSLVSRSSYFHTAADADAFTSFPSGHAAVSATIVTSWSLSHPEWYVIAPGVVWATSVSLSRLHLGVHYPSDILVGVGIGVGMAILVHELRATLTPDVIRTESRASLATPPPLTIRIRF